MHAVLNNRENDNDTDVLIANLRSGQYKALVLDAPVVEYLAGTEELCDLFVVGEVSMYCCGNCVLG